MSKNLKKVKNFKKGQKIEKVNKRSRKYEFYLYQESNEGKIRMFRGPSRSPEVKTCQKFFFDNII